MATRGVKEEEEAALRDREVNLEAKIRQEVRARRSAPPRAAAARCWPLAAAAHCAPPLLRRAAPPLLRRAAPPAHALCPPRRIPSTAARALGRARAAQATAAGAADGVRLAGRGQAALPRCGAARGVRGARRAAIRGRPGASLPPAGLGWGAAAAWESAALGCSWRRACKANADSAPTAVPRPAARPGPRAPVQSSYRSAAATTSRRTRSCATCGRRCGGGREGAGTAVAGAAEGRQPAAAAAALQARGAPLAAAAARGRACATPERPPPPPAARPGPRRRARQRQSRPAHPD
jgi:hypothetical protein